MGGNGEAPGRSSQCPDTPSCHAECSPGEEGVPGELSCRFIQRAFPCPHYLCMPFPLFPTELLLGSRCVTPQLPLWKEVGPWEGIFPPPGVGRRFRAAGGSQGHLLVSPPLSLHQFSGKFCGNLCHYLKPGQTEEGRAKFWGKRGPSETVSSRRTVPTQQPHGTLVHWRGTLRSRLHGNPAENKNRACAWSEAPFHRQDSGSPRRRGDQPGELCLLPVPGLTRPAPGAPPLGPTLPWPFLTPFL